MPQRHFFFDALVNHKIDTAGLEFDVQLEDVQTLNLLGVTRQVLISPK